MIVASQIKIREKSSRKALPAHTPISPEVRHTHHFALLPTAWGVSGIVWRLPSDNPNHFPNGFVERPTDALLCRIVIPGMAVSTLRGQLLKRFPASDEVFGDRRGNFHPEVVPRWFTELSRGMQSYYSDDASERTHASADFSNTWSFWKPRLDWSQVKPFQEQVLRHTVAIPRGQQLTYGQIAKRIGVPNAARAVGGALGANPWPVLVPCHRVVGANGAMTGFSAPGGVGAKRRMLAMEQPGLLDL